MTKMGDYRFMLIARLVISMCIISLSTGMIFVQPTDIKMNVASSLLGGLIGYWFGDNGAQQQNTQQTMIEGEKIDITANSNGNAATDRQSAASHSEFL